MALAPIDLQTLFTQVDKVGRAQVAEREGHANQQAMQGVHLQRKTDEQILQVNQAQDAGEGAEKINDRTNRQKNESKSKKEKGEDALEDDEEKDEKESFYSFRDPSLGNKIDISY